MKSDNPRFGPHLGDVLSALVDGELSDRQRVAAESHLAVCPACRADLEQTARVQRLVSGLPTLAVPATVWGGMMTGGRRPRPVAWVGAAAAVVGLSLLVASPSSHQVTPPMTRFVQVHAVSSGTDPVTQLAPAAIPASLGP